MLNKVFLIGRLTADVNVRKSSAGEEIHSFSLAVDSGVENEAYFFDVKVFGKLTGSSSLLHKGDKIAVEGRLNQTKWTSKDGSKRTSVEIIANSIEFISVKSVATAEEK